MSPQPAAPRVSVCVPTYNGEAHLAETLESILAQEHEDFELLVVDDGSTDGTLDIVGHHAASDSRIRVVRNAERAGSSVANANQCIRHARGEWLKFLYQDDTMVPSCLGRMLEAGLRAPLVVAWHRKAFMPDTSPETRRAFDHGRTLERVVREEYTTPESFRELVLRHWHGNFIGPTSTCMVHRRVFQRVGPFDSHYWTMPEEEFYVRAGIHVGLAVVPEPLVDFRVHEQSISGNIRKQVEFQYQQQLHQLELLLLVLHDPRFAPLRARALAPDSPIDLEALLRRDAAEARWLAIDARYRSGHTGMLERWDALLARQPSLPPLLRALDEASPWRSRLRAAVKRAIAMRR